MSLDTLTAQGSATILAVPNGDPAYHPTGYAVIRGSGEVAVAYTYSPMNSDTVATVIGYDHQGGQLFDDSFPGPAQADAPGYPYASSNSGVLAALSNGGLAYAYLTTDDGGAAVMFDALSASGSVIGSGEDRSQGFSNPANLSILAESGGWFLSWDAKSTADTQSVSNDAKTYSAIGYSSDMRLWPMSFDKGADGASALMQDNLIAYVINYTTSQAHLPNEPAGVLTASAVAVLADGDAAVTWVDSGTEYVSLYNPSTNSFSAPLTADWGGASDPHVLALTDGGFVVSWMKDGAYRGEVFAADGTHGAVMALDGDVAGIDSNGDLYTVGLNADRQYEIQTYAIGSAGAGGTGGSGGGSGSSVSTSDPDYTAPDGVTTITLTGSNQTIHANNGGDTIWSDNTRNTLFGGSGADTFHIGRAGDTVTGGAGADAFVYDQTPWGGSTITDFNNQDHIDIGGILAASHYTGPDAIADGYIKFTSDSSGNAQIWSDMHQPGLDNWWLVATLDGITASSLSLSGDAITTSATGPQVGPVSTSDPDYTAPDGVTSITLTGHDQTIQANNGGDTIWSDDTHNVLYGGTGDDTFHIGRAGDTVTGGGGSDVFAYADVPWGGSTITDFQSGDEIDLTGLVASLHDPGPDPFADGYLKYDTDASGSAQVWANYHQADNGGWWLVATLDGVSTSSLHYSGGMIT